MRFRHGLLGHTFSYDGENRPYLAGGVNYYYDGESERVAKSNGKLYWFGTNSAPVLETDTSGNTPTEYGFFNGKRVAMRKSDGSVHYYFADQVGSADVVTNATGAMPPEQDIEYHPYGEQQVYTDTLGQEYRFTGKERDSESGLDNFGARYYTSSMGRFMSPDWAARPTTVPYAVFGDPQSLNLYNYVRNDPISRIDPDGHYEVNASGCGGNNAAKCQKKYDKATQRFEQARQKDLKSKDPNVRAAAEAYGNSGEKNGVHVGFADLKSQGIKGEVDPTNSGKGKLIDVEVTVDIGLKGKSLQETVAHEGSHVGDDIDFLTSYNFGTGRYDPAANITHGQTEFDAFQTGAGVTREHGFGPHDDQKILDFLHNSPTYGPIFNVPVFNPNDPNYPQ